MYNKVNTQEFMLIVRRQFLYHTQDLVHSLYVDFKLHDLNFFIINVLTILQSFNRMFEEGKRMYSNKKIGL